MGFFDKVTNFFGVESEVSSAARVKPDDIVKTKQALEQTGHYQVPEHGLNPYPDTPMIEGLKKFQKDKGLKVDGIMRPGGPTEAALGQSLGQKGATTQPTSMTAEASPPPNPPTKAPPKIQAASTEEPSQSRDQRLRSLMNDPRYRDPRDPSYRNYVADQFKKAYPGKVEYDASGKMKAPVSVIRPEQVESYDDEKGKSPASEGLFCCG